MNKELKLILIMAAVFYVGISLYDQGIWPWNGATGPSGA